MTNLEYMIHYYPEILKEILKNYNDIPTCVLGYIAKHGKECVVEAEGDCDGCPFCKLENVLKALNEEYEGQFKESIKLKQWEYDLLVANDMPHNPMIKSFGIYLHMIGKGYFKGITDTSITIKEVLDNCEIVDDDYEWEETKQ